MGETKLLTDNAHRDGSRSRRSRPEAVKQAADDLVHSEDRTKTSEPRKSSSSKKLVGTPMKMLIAEEMSKESSSKRKTSNVVARLMGLDDSLPTHSTAKGRADRGRSPSCVTLASVLHDGRQQEDRKFDMPMPRGIRSYAHGEDRYRDVYEVRQQTPRIRHVKDQYLHKGICDENQSERRMALVRQKFMEAKQLATNEKLLRSKEFEDALEVLSSNRDLFLKFLEEPNSIFSKHLKGLHSKPSPPETKRITVLKPSRTPMTKGGVDLDKPQWSSSATQSTRIVVLKPTVARHLEYDTKPVVTSTSTTSSSEISESIRSRELAKVITCQMRENIGFHRRDESLLSSVLSNGYVADESSFNRSENEYIEEEGASFNDLEIVTPTSRHSWDYVKRYGSPYSLSIFSHAPCSPEPPVITEAKKRLSERCAMVSSHELNREQMDVRRSSSTLGEMLAYSEIKEEGLASGGFTGSTGRSFGGEEDSRVSTDCMPAYKTNNGDDGETSTCNLSRSKSVPVSSAYENIGLNLANSDSQVDKDVKVKKPIVPSETAKPKNRKSYFKGKVSRLFFSRSKKIDSEELSPSLLVVSNESIQSDITKAICEGSAEDIHLNIAKEESVDTSTLLKDGAEQGSISFKAALFLEKPSTPQFLGNHQRSPSTSGKTGQNQDQPSPTSVLEVPFEDDCSTSNSCEMSDTGHPFAPIEEVTRSLSWDDTHLSSPSSSELSRTSPKANEENHWHLFVQSLMSAADFDNEKASTIFTRFYSVDSPLDPKLLDRFLDRKEEDSRSRERRSNLRLVFDCVNYTLLDIDRTVYLGMYLWAGTCNGVRKKSGVPVSEEVWLLVRDWVCREQKLGSDDIDNGGTVVDREVSRDIGGSGWAELMRSEIDEIGREISGKLLVDLVGEALADFSAACFM